MARLFVLLQYLLPQHLLSRLVAVLANSRVAVVKNTLIRLFAHQFQVNMEEAKVQDYRQFATFNDFFTRELQDNARPIATAEQSLVSPADGAISQLGKVRDERLLQAKGINYSITALLGGDSEAAQPFRDGCFMTIYLSPRDYHRIHMPIAGTLLSTVYIPGRLFSVNQHTAERVDGLFTRNERLVCFFDTPAGPMAMVLVGAMIVAGIDTVWAGHVCPNKDELKKADFRDHQPAIQLAKGSEMGRFKLGSTVILLYGPGAVNLNTELQANSPVRMGETIGTLTSQ